MTTSKWAHTGAVLVGGSASRLGRPKHDLVSPDGVTFLDATFGALGQLCREVVVVGSIEGDFPMVSDLRDGMGPLAGIEALLTSDLDDQYLICPVDIPLITADVLQRLTVSTTRMGTIFQVDGETKTQSLPVRLSTSALPLVAASLDAGRAALHSLWEELDFQYVPLPPTEGSKLININTQADYRRLMGQRRSGS